MRDILFTICFDNFGKSFNFVKYLHGDEADNNEGVDDRVDVVFEVACKRQRKERHGYEGY